VLLHGLSANPLVGRLGARTGGPARDRSAGAEN
jgi:hypothetical protein